MLHLNDLEGRRGLRSYRLGRSSDRGKQKSSGAGARMETGASLALLGARKERGLKVRGLERNATEIESGEGSAGES